jgi:hypothetical protein
VLDDEPDGGGDTHVGLRRAPIAADANFFNVEQQRRLEVFGQVDFDWDNASGD